MKENRHFTLNCLLLSVVIVMLASTWNTAAQPAKQPSPQPSPLAKNSIQNKPEIGFIGKDPQPAGTVSWQQLLDVKLAKKARKSIPEFNEQILALNKQKVRIYGFMLPLSTADKQNHFLITMFPPHCPFCLAGGPASMVEVLAAKPLNFSYDPIIVEGTFEVVQNDQVYYRLTNAMLVKM